MEKGAGRQHVIVKLIEWQLIEFIVLLVWLQICLFIMVYWI